MFCFGFTPNPNKFYLDHLTANEYIIITNNLGLYPIYFYNDIHSYSDIFHTHVGNNIADIIK